MIYDLRRYAIVIGRCSLAVEHLIRNQKAGSSFLPNGFMHMLVAFWNNKWFHVVIAFKFPTVIAQLWLPKQEYKVDGLKTLHYTFIEDIINIASPMDRGSRW